MRRPTFIAEAGPRQLDCPWVILLGHPTDGSCCGQMGIVHVVAGEPGLQQRHGLRIAFRRHLPLAVARWISLAVEVSRASTSVAACIRVSQWAARGRVTAFVNLSPSSAHSARIKEAVCETVRPYLRGWPATARLPPGPFFSATCLMAVTAVRRTTFSPSQASPILST